MTAVSKLLFVLVGVVLVAGVFVALNWKRWARWRKLGAAGEEAVAWIVGVDPDLFHKPASDEDVAGPAGVLVPTDPRDAADDEFMLDLIDRCHALRDAKPADPKLKALRREVRDDSFREGVWVKLPAAWNDGPPIYYTVMEVHRECLPKGRLKRRYVRVKYLPDEPEQGAMHVPYHDDDADDRPYAPRKRRRPAD